MTDFESEKRVNRRLNIHIDHSKKIDRDFGIRSVVTIGLPTSCDFDDPEFVKAKRDFINAFERMEEYGCKITVHQLNDLVTSLSEH